MVAAVTPRAVSPEKGDGRPSSASHSHRTPLYVRMTIPARRTPIVEVFIRCGTRSECRGHSARDAPRAARATRRKDFVRAEASAATSVIIRNEPMLPRYACIPHHLATYGELMGDLMVAGPTGVGGDLMGGKAQSGTSGPPR